MKSMNTLHNFTQENLSTTVFTALFKHLQYNIAKTEWKRIKLFTV